jgi:hypothetical protein
MLADAVLGQNYSEQKIAGDTESLGVGVVQGIEVIRHLLGKITALLTGKTDAPTGLTIILIDDHGWIGSSAFAI